MDRNDAHIADTAKRYADDALGRMDLRQKIGQCFTLGFRDCFLRPDVGKGIREFHCAGLRLVPWEREGVRYAKDEDRCFKGGAIAEDNPRRMGSAVYATPRQYAELLNRWQQMALDRPYGTPLHFAIDQEGDAYNDYIRGGVNLLPSQMGLAATGDPQNAYRAARAAGRQLKALGAHMIHSPVLEVNVNPANPEMNFRAFGDDAETVAEYASGALRGYREAGITAVAKHFPGRGASGGDAHYDLCYYEHDGEAMRAIDLLPYRRLIGEGLEAVMVAHTVYPGLGDGERPASVSPTVVRDVLRGELGFEGVVTTDSITMRGLLNMFGLPEACLRAIEVGNDLILYRGYLSEFAPVIDHIEQAVRGGRLKEDVLDDRVGRVLAYKARAGIVDAPLVDLGRVEDPLHDEGIVALSKELPAKTAQWVQRGQAARLAGDTKVLVAEQCNRFAWQANDVWYHPGMLWEAMTTASNEADNVRVVECTMTGKDDFPRIAQQAEGVDVIVATSYYCRTTDHNLELIRKIVALGKPVVAVTNNPFLCKDLLMCDSVLLLFSGNPRGLQAVSDILYGTAKPTGRWPLTHCPKPVA